MLPWTDYPKPIGSFRAPVRIPDVEPTDGPQVAVCFSVEWLPYVLGALTQLMLQATWVGSDADIALAQRRAATLIAHIATPETSCATEAPFWDKEDGEDADDGGEYTFSERVEDWAIAAFIMSSGVVGAAVTYLAIAPKFRLLFRRQDWGGIARIFLDGELYQEADTYSPVADLLAVDVNASAIAGPHTLRIEVADAHNGAAVANALGQFPIEIVRKRLYEEETSVPEFDITDDGDLRYRATEGSEWVTLGPVRGEPGEPGANAPTFTPEFYMGITIPGYHGISYRYAELPDVPENYHQIGTVSDGLPGEQGIPGTPGADLVLDWERAARGMVTTFVEQARSYLLYWEVTRLAGPTETNAVCTVEMVARCTGYHTLGTPFTVQWFQPYSPYDCFDEKYTDLYGALTAYAEYDSASPLIDFLDAITENMVALLTPELAGADGLTVASFEQWYAALLTAYGLDSRWQMVNALLSMFDLNGWALALAAGYLSVPAATEPPEPPEEWCIVYEFEYGTWDWTNRGGNIASSWTEYGIHADDDSSTEPTFWTWGIDFPEPCNITQVRVFHAGVFSAANTTTMHLFNTTLGASPTYARCGSLIDNDPITLDECSSYPDAPWDDIYRLYIIESNQGDDPIVTGTTQYLRTVEIHGTGPNPRADRPCL